MWRLIYFLYKRLVNLQKNNEKHIKLKKNTSFIEQNKAKYIEKDLKKYIIITLKKIT